jgi:small-conductance mechanosensitive channel
MRMFHYIAGAAALAVPALLVTAGLGIAGYRGLHLSAGLVTAILTIGLHSLVIIFMIVTGRILREAVRSRDLSQSFLDELNEFFGRKAAYPAAVFAAFLLVVAGVLGYTARGLGWPAWIHWCAGALALVYNLWAVPVELKALSDNQDLVDRAAGELDRLDAEAQARGEELPPDAPVTPETMARWAMIVAISVWMPYLYWVFVVWRGRFEKTSIHPFVEISVLALGVCWLARREASRPAEPAP